MADQYTSESLREWAAQCAEQAANAASSDDRETLKKMEEALLELATNQEWLDGKKPASGIEFPISL